MLATTPAVAAAPPDNLAGRIAERFLDALRRGVWLCPHVGATSPTIWDGGMPGVLCCALCTPITAATGCHWCGTTAGRSVAYVLPMPGLLGSSTVDGSVRCWPPALTVIRESVNAIGEPAPAEGAA